MKIFQLTFSTYDYAQNYYYEGSVDVSQEDFKALCDTLMRESATYLVAGEGSRLGHNIASLGMDVFVDEVSHLLTEHGFTRVRFTEVTYHGPTIINDDDDDNKKIAFLGNDLIKQISEHNKKEGHILWGLI
jgi:hemerythrin-like domain-containing protein